jgi:hypothetical protein
MTIKKVGGAGFSSDVTRPKAALVFAETRPEARR